MKLLLTAFDPFGGSSVNPALEAIKLIPDQLDQIQIIKLEIPTVFERSISVINSALETFLPDAVLCIGQAGGRSAITPERIAVNIRDGKIPDNAGFRPNGEQVSADGPAAYFTTLPVADMVAAISTTGVPAVASNSAGAFVCNDTLYSLLHHYAGTAVRVGFIHVPYLPEQGTPNLPLADIVRGLEAAIFAL